MGSLIHTLKEVPPREREETALRFVKSALLDMGEVEVLGVELFSEDEEIYIKAYLKYKDDKIEMEVRA